MLIHRQTWFLILGRDVYNSCAGITFGHSPLKPDGIRDAWSVVWRVNIRWPITFRRKLRHPPGYTE